MLVATSMALALEIFHAWDAGLSMLANWHEANTRKLVENILDGFVLIELLRSFGDYLASHRIQVSLLLETALVFVLREMASGLYSGHDHLGSMLGYSLLIPALLVARKIACPRDREGA